MMTSMQARLQTARLNILRCLDTAGEFPEETALDAGVDPEKLRHFIAGSDSLTLGEVLRVCRRIELPFWALLVPNVSMDVCPHDPQTMNVERQIFALKSAETFPN